MSLRIRLLLFGVLLSASFGRAQERDLLMSLHEVEPEISYQMGWLLPWAFFFFSFLLASTLFLWKQLREARKELSRKNTLIEALEEDVRRNGDRLGEAPDPAGEAPLIVAADDDTWRARLEDTVRANKSDLHFGVDRLAELMGMGRTGFFRRIRSVVGMTPNEYIREIRLQTARELLESGQTTDLKVLCERVGMRSTHYFSKLYEERFGKPPGAVF